jgi:WD40 repeat protein/serine/threonine protein kinase
MTEREIFVAALHQPGPAERRAFLDRACGDPDARARVEALLAAHEGLGSFLEGPAGAPPGTGTYEPAEAPAAIAAATVTAGSMVGPYKLLEVIGEGGMGAVWMASQAEPIRRRVAVKVVKAGMDSKRVLARFEAERQALALMDHPNIARVLDAGATPAGRPYFVMELVKGVPITKYCDERHLTPRQRLELFMPVCHAIQHAHQKGIVHRDIKPSNVLVALYDDHPVPKVIDFGIAKAVGQQLTERTVHTGFGDVVGTLEYMSPEQASFNQLDVDTRSDIYSLGVLLYELLAGSPPFTREDLERAGILEMLRLIREQEPSRPSTKLSTADGLPTLAAKRGTEPVRLTRLVRGELDWIVMKALEKDRGRRYETANGFAADVQRYLADEPVLACPPSAWYRFRKSARRHRAALATGALIATLLAVGTVVSTWLAIRATDAERLAEDRLETEKEERARAVRAEQERKRQLVGAKLAQARAGRWSHQVGQRFDGLRALTEAAALARELEMDASVFQDLRDEMVACLALADIRPLGGPWEGFPAGSIFALGFDADLGRYARSDAKGNIEVRQVEGDRLLARLLGYGGGVEEMRFSQEGSLLAVQYGRQIPGQPTSFQVWDWRRKVVVFQPKFSVDGGRAFRPDGRQLVLGRKDGTFTMYETAHWTEAARLKVDFPVAHLAYHPDGTRLAFSGGGKVEVWDIATGKPLYRMPAPQAEFLAWHPDGDLLAAGCADRKVHLWDGTTGRPHAALGGHQNGGVLVAFAAGGDLAVSTAWDGTSRLWDPWAGRELLRFMGDARSVSRDGRRLASRAGRTLAVWEVNPGREYLTLPARPGRLANWGISPDGRWLVTGGDWCRVWDVVRRKEVATLPLAVVLDAAFHPDGGELFTSGHDGLYRWSFGVAGEILRIRPTARLLPPGRLERLGLDRDGRLLAVARMDRGGGAILDVENPPGPVPPLEHANAISATLSPDGRWAATGTHNGFGVRVWDARTGKRVAELIPDARLSRPIFSPDGRWLLTATGTEFGIWEPGTWRPVRKIAREQTGDVPAAAAFAPGGKVLAVADSLTTVRLFDTETWRPLARLQGPDADLIKEVGFTPDGTRLLVSSPGEVIRVWDLRQVRERLAEAGLDWDQPAYPPALPPADVKPVRAEVDFGEARRFTGHTREINSLARSPTGDRAFSAADDGSVRVWDVKAGAEIRRFEGHKGPVFSVAVSPTGRRALSAGHDGAVCLWDADTGRELHRSTTPGVECTSVAFSPCGRNALFGASDGSVRLWDVDAWKEVRRFDHTPGLWSVAFSPEGARALTAGGNQGKALVRLWDLASGKEVRRFEGHREGVWRAVFSPKGDRVLTVGGDSTCRLWDVRTGKELRQLGQAHFQGAAFSHDGRLVVTSFDSALSVWDAETGKDIDRILVAGSRIITVIFLPDGSVLAGGSDGTIRLWRPPAAGRPRR